ncbi:MAG: flagellin [Methanolinea sp.]|nr:flagellin [Methanolinea sp.]
MSSETIVTALFLISAVIAAGVLINAIFPAIYRTADTFGSVTTQAETKIRTDFRIVNTFANSTAVKVWVKNVGSARIHANELDNGDLYAGNPGNFERWSLKGLYDRAELGNSYWDPGETLTLTKTDIGSYLAGSDDVYVAIVLPNGARREMSFSKFSS